MDHVLLQNKLEMLPESLKSEVSDFIDFLLSKNNKLEKDSGKRTPKFGSGKGMFVMKPGFDDPIEDFKEYMDS
jgi:hypothetical protein